MLYCRPPRFSVSQPRGSGPARSVRGGGRGYLTPVRLEASICGCHPACRRSTPRVGTFGRASGRISFAFCCGIYDDELMGGLSGVPGQGAVGGGACGAGQFRIWTNSPSESSPEVAPSIPNLPASPNAVPKAFGERSFIGDGVGGFPGSGLITLLFILFTLITTIPDPSLPESPSANGLGSFMCTSLT